jgi:hypothetical protein
MKVLLFSMLMNLLSRLTSRKFWLAMAGIASALVIAWGGSADEAAKIAGIITAGATAISYMFAQGAVDKASAANTTGSQIALTKPPDSTSGTI